MSCSSPPSDRSSPSVPAHRSRHQVLFVDDHEHLRQLYVAGLRAFGYAAVAAASPLELQRRLAEPAPDLIVLDLQRAAADGLDAVRRLRARPHLQHTPIVFLASVGDDDFRWEALSAGVDRYLLRPLPPGELGRHIAELLCHGRPATVERQRRQPALIVTWRRTG